MYRSLSLISTLLLAAPLAFGQAPGQPPSPDPGATQGRPGMSDRHEGPDRGVHGSYERDAHDGRMHGEGERDGFGGMHVPPGTWWRNPELVNRIGLSADQVKRIDGIFLESRVQLIHMHASLEEEQLRLEPLIAANPVNQQAALQQISKIADTRADLEKANAKMLLAIRGVLTGDQWTKLQQRSMGPHDMGGPGGGNGPHRPVTPNGPPAPPAQ